MKEKILYRTIEAPFMSCTTSDEHYVFVCYAHQDAEKVFEVIKKLYEAGINVFYDYGTEVDEYYERRGTDGMDNCDAAIIFMSDNAANNKHVGKTIGYLGNCLGNKEIIRCDIDKITVGMPSAIDQALSATQSNSLLSQVSEQELVSYLTKKDDLCSAGKRKAKPFTAKLSIDACEDMEDYVYEQTSSPYNGLILTRYKGDDSAVVIPRKYNNSNIVSLRGTFEYKTLTSVIIPGSVKIIDDGSFKHCVALESVTIENGVEIIGKDAFANCLKLKQIFIPQSVKEIRCGAFKNCENLLMGMIAASAEKDKISGDAFYGCKKLTITCGKGKKKGEKTGIHQYALEKHIPVKIDSSELFNAKDGDKEQSDSEEKVCESFKYISSTDEKRSNTAVITAYTGKSASVAVPRKIKKSKDLKKALTVTQIGKNAFSGCSKLNSVKLAKGLEVIGDFAFDGCSSLSEVVIPNSVEAIGNGAFYGCDDLKAVVIKSDIKSVSANAFSFCNDDLVIYGVPGSKIEDYAKKNGIKFKKKPFFMRFK